MKRTASFLMAAALAVSLVLPAAAADETTQDARLSQVTQAVKDTLDLDTSQYDTFYGECYDQTLVSQWSLYWSGSLGSLSIDALEDGTILWYSLSQEEAEQSGLPSYPQGGDSAQIRAAAQAFLEKVLKPGVESAELGESSGGDILGSNSCRFSGTILFSGLPSPLGFSITVDGRSGQVVRFSRDVSYGTFLGEIPSATPAVGQAAAAQALKSSLSLKLEYVLPEDGSTQAVLRYVPDGGDEYYVDAQTGELVNLTQLQRDMADAGLSGGAGTASDSTAESQENGLSQAEQEGIQKLEGVLSKETLDGQLRAVSEYGLEDYALSFASYRLVDGEKGQEDQVLCTLRYLLPGEEETASRTFTVDARTGEVESLWSYLPWEEGQEPALTREQAQRQAEEFLKTFCPDWADQLALYSSSEGEVRTQYSFTFARQENGYFFPEHSFAVGISAQDGAVCGLSYTYDEAVTFDSPEGIISSQEALDAWMETYTVELGYLQVPEELDPNDPSAAPYLQLGLKAFYVLKLGYSLERDGYYSGVDAKTGQPVQREYGSSWLVPAYTDVEGHWAQGVLETLAQYRVGYAGGTFAPDQTMTQWDLVALLYSVENYPLDPTNASEGERDAAYAAAYRLGALTSGERQDSAPLTRSQAVKLLLNAQGLGRAAQLSGIYVCTYSDKAAIPAEGAVMLHKLLSW